MSVVQVVVLVDGLDLLANLSRREQTATVEVKLSQFSVWQLARGSRFACPPFWASSRMKMKVKMMMMMKMMIIMAALNGCRVSISRANSYFWPIVILLFSLRRWKKLRSTFECYTIELNSMNHLKSSNSNSNSRRRKPIWGRALTSS